MVGNALAAIAQLGERQTEDLKVPSSILGLGKRFGVAPVTGEGGRGKLEDGCWMEVALATERLHRSFAHFMFPKKQTHCKTSKLLAIPTFPQARTHCKSQRF